MANYYCMNCGSLVPAGKKFCPVCGDPVVGDNTLQTAELTFPADPETEKTFNYVPVDDPKPVEVSPTQENAKTIAVDRPQPKQEAPKKEKKQSFLSSIFFEEVEVEDDEEEEEKNPKQAKEKHHSILPVILLILLAVLVGAFGFLYFEKPALLNQGLNSIGLGLPGYTQKAAATTATASPSASAAASASASATAAATATPAATTASTSLGTLTVNVESINIRDAASTAGNAVGKATSGKTYTVLATKSGEGYTWYEIEKDQWVADGGGDWVTYTAK